jgi:hypothetical protein
MRFRQFFPEVPPGLAASSRSHHTPNDIDGT